MPLCTRLINARQLCFGEACIGLTFDGSEARFVEGRHLSSYSMYTGLSVSRRIPGNGLPVYGGGPSVSRRMPGSGLPVYGGRSISLHDERTKMRRHAARVEIPALEAWEV